MRRHLLVLALALAGGCATPEATVKKDQAEAPPATPPAPPPPSTLTVDASKPMPPGLDPKAMDTTVSPCDDFYQYACGGWMAATEIPADKPQYSRGFVAIRDRNEASLKQILEDAAAGTLPKDTPFAKQLGDFYATCMDEAAVEKALPQFKKRIAPLTRVKNATELARAVAAAHLRGLNPLFNAGAAPDYKDSTQVIAWLFQGGLGLPDRDYYTESDERSAAIRAAYLAHVQTMLTLYGEKPEAARQMAEDIMKLETALATASMTRVQRRDPVARYNRIERAGLKDKAPAFPWDVYFTELGMKGLTTISVNHVPFFAEVSRVAAQTPPAVLNAYLTWVAIRGSVPALPRAFQDEQFAFFSRNFSGAKEDRPRWKKCVAYTDGALGEALGREYARRHFPEESKQRALAMVKALQGSFEKNLGSLEWMDEATRANALAKVQRMVGNNKIGYPDRWRDYTALSTDRKSFLGNLEAAERFEVARDLTKIGKPVDRTEWGMSPPTVNAYYNGSFNEIVFPAGILQPPFFAKDATDAVNFGSMGMVVGHEITHGFDDQGRKFDVEGNLKDWWTEAVGKQFVDKASCVKRQYDTYEAISDTGPVKNVMLKGDLTLGENVADLGGLKLAHEAMKRWYADRPAEELRYTPSQQFFLGAAQAWCTKTREQEAVLRAKTDPHAPPYWRVNGPLGNLASFREAFQCTSSAKMVRAAEALCEVW